ncbi:MAG: OmpA family protein, partial [FCB group bacterium]
NEDIEDNKIVVVPRPNNCYPQDYAWRKTEDGHSENRRVEIDASNPALFAPVAGEKYEEVEEVLPVSFEFTPTINEPDKVINWNLFASQNGKNIFELSGNGNPKDIPYNISDNDIRKINPDLPLNISINVFDDKGNSTSASKILNFVKDTSDYEIERLTLVLFKLSDFTLDKRMKNDINNFLHGLDSNSTISIIGYSDSLGDEASNITLSDMRAMEVRNFILGIAPKAKIEKVTGVGSKKYAPGIFSYSTQEERFLARTVELIIKKKRNS